MTTLKAPIVSALLLVILIGQACNWDNEGIENHRAIATLEPIGTFVPIARQASPTLVPIAKQASTSSEHTDEAGTPKPAAEARFSNPTPRTPIPPATDIHPTRLRLALNIQVKPTPTQPPIRTLPTPVPPPTIEDAIPQWAYEKVPSLTQYILSLPWATDSLTPFELNTIQRLIRYVRTDLDPAIDQAIDSHLLVDPHPFAIDIIQEIQSFQSAPEITDPRQIQFEHRVINLPLRGQTNLMILRAQPGSLIAMDLLENAVRSAEQFMAVPFPTDQVTLRFTKNNITKGYAGSYAEGTFSGGQVQILPTHDQHALMTTHYSSGNELLLAQIIAHEISHYYWHHHRNWINEGMANTLEAFIENARVGTAITPSSPRCTHYRTIMELETALSKRSEFSKFECNYSMGESLFLDLRNVLGDQQFLQSAQRLYKTRTAPNIESVKSAFSTSDGTLNVINRHYYGQPPLPGIETSPQPPPDQVASVSLRLEREQTLPPWDYTPLTSISASHYYGPIILVVTGTSRSRGSQPVATLTVEHTESSWAEQSFIEIHQSVGILYRIGPKRTPWLQGTYRATIEQTGDTIAEISWAVTP